MASTIKLKNSVVQGTIPLVTDLILGELAVNSYDGKIFLKKNNGVESIVDLTTNFVTFETLNANGDVGTGATQLAIGNHTHAYEPLDANILRVSDIVNNLTTGGISDPLSAEMGKALNTNKLGITSAPVFTANTITARTANTNLTIGGSGTGGVVVTGNLTVQGNLTTTTSNQVEIGDSIIRLNALLGSSTAPTTNAGFEVERGSSADVSLVWNETSDKWTLTEDGTNFKNILHSGNLGITTGNVVSVSSTATASDFAVWSATGLTSITDANARASLNVDMAGTDNSTNVTLAGTPNYLTIAGQAITLNKLDISDDTNLITGTGLTLATNTLSVNYGLTSTTALRGDSGINALSDVNTSTVPPVDGNVLTWDSTTSKWVPEATSVSYTGWTVTDGTTSENVLSAQSLRFSSSTASFLTVGYNTTSNTMNFAINTGTTASTLALGNHNHLLDNLSNVVITTIASGELLKWNGTKWINNTLAEAGIEPSFSKNTAFNKNFGTAAGTVSEGNHTHTLAGLTDTAITLAGTAADGGLILVYNEATDKWTSTAVIDGGTF